MFHKICVLDTGLHYEEEEDEVSAITHSIPSHPPHYQQPYVADSALFTTTSQYDRVEPDQTVFGTDVSYTADISGRDESGFDMIGINHQSVQPINAASISIAMDTSPTHLFTTSSIELNDSLSPTNISRGLSLDPLHSSLDGNFSAGLPYDTATLPGRDSTIIHDIAAGLPMDNSLPMEGTGLIPEDSSTFMPSLSVDDGIDFSNIQSSVLQPQRERSRLKRSSSLSSYSLSGAVPNRSRYSDPVTRSRQPLKSLDLGFNDNSNTPLRTNDRQLISNKPIERGLSVSTEKRPLERTQQSLERGHEEVALSLERDLQLSVEGMMPVERGTVLPHLRDYTSGIRESLGPAFPPHIKSGFASRVGLYTCTCF